MKTNIIGEFLKIIKSFPKNNILSKIINTNNIKASYRTVPNMANEISRKNGRILKNKTQLQTPKCNCQVSRKADCLLPGQCTIKNICYLCKVTRLDNNTSKSNVGITVQMAKSRFKQNIDDGKKWRPNTSGIEMSKLS